jgi:acetyl-CoA C-acetyltransferase
LTFGGGPLNNYVMHSVARTVELLREKQGARALITANGGNLYKHAHGIYSSEAPSHDFSVENVQADIDALPSRQCLAEFVGDATIESYTVMFNGDDPTIAHLACRTADDARTWVNTQDPDIMNAMLVEEFCARPVHIKGSDELTVLS